MGSAAAKSDVVVIGAGPAGLSAARTAAACGLAVVIIDEAPAAGGQIYRGIGAAGQAHAAILGADYSAGRSLLDGLDDDAINYISGATVFEISEDRLVYYSQNGRAYAIAGEHIIIAAGAMERAMPFPGWELPGVMSAGAGQTLLKSAGVLPATDVVLAGSGPLLYLFTVQLIRAGRTPRALVDTTPSANRFAALSALPRAIAGRALLQKGLQLLREIRRSGVQIHRGATELRAVAQAEADGANAHLHRLEFATGGGRQRHRIDTGTLLVHQGVVPNVQLSRAMGLDHVYDAVQHCWNPQLGANGATARPGVWISGDCGGISGADAARESGTLTAYAVASAMGRTLGEKSRQHRDHCGKTLARHLAPRRFLDLLYRPDDVYLAPPLDETLVCRCEEVRAGDIRKHVADGCLGPNQTKAFSRCGMGPCQGRMCGLTISELIARARHVEPDTVGYYRIRFPIKPVSLGELATLADDPEQAENQRAPAT